MDAVLVAIQFLHILAGVVWLGGSVFMTFFVLPAVFAHPWRNSACWRAESYSDT